MGISSRNSGVIHAGLYYPADSLKTRFCRRGAQLLYDFCARHNVPHQRTGKYIVANGPQQIQHLDWLEQHVDGVPLHRTANLPGSLKADAALFSPNSGIVDIHALIDTLLSRSGAEILYHQEVSALESGADGVSFWIDGVQYQADCLINCAGLGATRFTPDYHHHMARGCYFQIRLPKGLELPHLVYPAVPKGSPSLGTHLTRNIYGEAYLGPDIEWITTESYAVDPNRRDSFLQAARQYLPWLEDHHLQPGYAGIRPKLSATEFMDFHIVQDGPLIHCLGIESLGLTAAMAIGEHIAGELQ